MGKKDIEALRKKERETDFMRFNLIQKRSKYIQRIYNKPSITRIFFLILDGKDYGQELSKRYYDSKNRNVRMKANSNPKVISIYLRKLLDAGLIKKGKKEGHIQRYEIDWNGVFDVIVFGNTTKISEGWTNIVSDCLNYNKVVKPKDKKRFVEEEIYKFFIDNIVKPYFVSKKDYLNLPKVETKNLTLSGYFDERGFHDGCYSWDEIEDIEKKYGDNKDIKIIKPHNFDSINFSLEEEFKNIRIILEHIYETNPQFINEYLKNEKNKKCVLYWFYNFERNFNKMFQGYYENKPEGKVIDNIYKILKQGGK